MMKIFALPALAALAALALVGCAAPEQTYPTTAEMSRMETDLKTPVNVPAQTPLAPGN